jgi:hypothetical protein
VELDHPGRSAAGGVRCLWVVGDDQDLEWSRVPIRIDVLDLVSDDAGLAMRDDEDTDRRPRVGLWGLGRGTPASGRPEPNGIEDVPERRHSDERGDSGRPCCSQEEP